MKYVLTPKPTPRPVRKAVRRWRKDDPPDLGAGFAAAEAAAEGADAPEVVVCGTDEEARRRAAARGRQILANRVTGIIPLQAEFSKGQRCEFFFPLDGEYAGLSCTEVRQQEQRGKDEKKASLSLELWPTSNTSARFQLLGGWQLGSG